MLVRFIFSRPVVLEILLSKSWTDNTASMDKQRHVINGCVISFVINRNVMNISYHDINGIGSC